MSESFQIGQPQPAVEPVFGGASAGALLKAAREAQGLHIGALAVMLKVPVRKLEALEADRLDELLDMVFTRALAASVCRALKIDPAAVLAALPQSEKPGVKTSAANLNTPFKTDQFALGQQLKSRLTSPLVLGAGLLVLGIVAILFWPDLQRFDVVSKDVANPEFQTSQVTTSVMHEPTASAVVKARLSAVSQNLASTGQETVPSAADTPAAGAETLTLQSRGSSWVEVTDAKGLLLLRKTLAPGEQIRLAGALPLSVVLGRADEVEVSVRGQRLDVTAKTRDNVARFEVE
ncbi:RodZ domain-containing protein [Rhodoferax sp.]|uniref:helix-turn-helix domain-containing protein n=1 Tax=Rhodoferax sp. TaxID=50421 RepID=UPI0026171F2A|nr:RodZ domain-containing protein [Rhodoferax sp.]MDD2919581.1 DUF4115 domain-containing protein [Rhodoferax sp.]